MLDISRMTSVNYQLSEAFHKKYGHLYDHAVKMFMRNGGIVEGVFCDEFFEDGSILVSGSEIMFIKIADIERVEPA